MTWNKAQRREMKIRKGVSRFLTLLVSLIFFSKKERTGNDNL